MKFLLGILISVCVGALGAYALIHTSHAATLAVPQGYQAVLLDNNQVYFGKLSKLDTDYPMLTDVYYIQAAVNPETHQSTNVLTKRGKEWHAPDRMLINAHHIIMIEPVTDGSTVAHLIEQANKK